MNNINITVQLCEEDRKRVDEVIGFLGLIASEMKSHPNVVSFTPETADEPDEEYVPRPLDPNVIMPAPVAEPEKPKYTKDDVQAKVRKLAAPGSPKRLEAKAIVQSYAAKVSDIPEDKYDEVMAKLAELEG